MRIGLVSVIVMLIVGCLTSAYAQIAPFGARLAVNRSLAQFLQTGPAGTFQITLDLQNPQGGEFRLFFDQIQHGTDVDFEIRIITELGVIARISGASFAAQQQYASEIFKGGQFTVEVAGPRKPPGLSFRLSEISYNTDQGRALSVTGQDQRVKVFELTNGDIKKAQGRAVTKIDFRSEDGFDYLCTGFMVGPDKLLTNDHCLGTDYRCSTAVIIFGYFTEDSMVEQHRCQKLIAHNFDYDFSLIQLDTRAGDNWGVLHFGSKTPAMGERLYILQHPSGRTQEISEVDCVLRSSVVQGNTQKSDFSNTCDTEGGGVWITGVGFPYE